MKEEKKGYRGQSPRTVDVNKKVFTFGRDGSTKYVLKEGSENIVYFTEPRFCWEEIHVINPTTRVPNYTFSKRHRTWVYKFTGILE